jgi:hypothetical protein
MAANVTPMAPVQRTPRYHAVLLAAFLRGATVDEAAAAARISRRQTLRWKGRYAATLEEARAHLLEAAQARLRDQLPENAEVIADGARRLGAVVPAAVARLAAILADPDADTTHVRLAAATVLDASARQAAVAFDVHHRLTEHHDLERRFAALEEQLASVQQRLALAALAPATTSFLARNAGTTTPAQPAQA